MLFVIGYVIAGVGSVLFASTAAPLYISTGGILSDPIRRPGQ
jgi:hypothetical protein